MDTTPDHLHVGGEPELPSGTVSLLFSDIEGSTALLSRLGPRYPEALDLHRRLLRSAWAAYGGTEMGTEGDSFFVAFTTAGAAVGAAVQVQRALAAADWPEGARVRVRIGIHTGAPKVHDGGYVGMDVHRAARIAAAAHGGQVVLSETAATLSAGSPAPGTRLRDLGSHRLKDLAVPERLFQVVIDGLPNDFPVVRSLGAVSGLPRPATPMVGREAEVARLVSLLTSPGTRLVTLTGPGGSGKTRLAVGVASMAGPAPAVSADGVVDLGSALVDRFPDGVYFVGLSAVGTADVMWTSIGEVLDVTAEDRMPPRLLTHLQHRRGLLVLDNLEQVQGADAVVDRLLDAAPGVVVLATSRRPLHVADELEHAVPPLELPPLDAHRVSDDVAWAGASGAVQLFVQQVRRWNPAFALTEENAADVVGVCRRLDGLPLAIELAAARVRLLSPKALLPRLDTALDLAAGGAGRPERQRTLRDTVAWSYRLLAPREQAFFRRLGVFSGGAGLDAVAAACEDVLDGSDPLDLLAELVDASLVTVGDDARGEPRLGMLGIIGAYAREEAAAADELDDVQRRHAGHYLGVAERIRSLMRGGAGQVGEARVLFELEQRNFRAALTWALPAEGQVPPPDVTTGMRFAGMLAPSWRDGGYYAEGQRWLERATVAGGQTDTVELGDCLVGLAEVVRSQGDQARALALALRAEQVLRRLGDDPRLTGVLSTVGESAVLAGDLALARRSYAEARALARRNGQERELALALSGLGWLAGLEGRLEEALELKTSSAEIFEKLGSVTRALRGRHNIACTLRDLGREQEAYEEMRRHSEQILRLGDKEFVAAFVEDLAHVLVRLDRHQQAALLLGAAEAWREDAAIPRPPVQSDEIREAQARARSALAEAAWREEHDRGAGLTVDEALEAVFATVRS